MRSAASISRRTRLAAPASSFAWLYADAGRAGIDGGSDELVAERQRQRRRAPTAARAERCRPRWRPNACSREIARRADRSRRRAPGRLRHLPLRRRKSSRSSRAFEVDAHRASRRCSNARRAVPADAVARERGGLDGKAIAGLDGVDQPQLEKSLSIFRALEGLAQGRALCRAGGALLARDVHGIRLRGLRADGPHERGPGACACEADMYGALTALALQEIAGEPSFLVDIVDMDAADRHRRPLALRPRADVDGRSAQRRRRPDPLQPPDAAAAGVRPASPAGSRPPGSARRGTRRSSSSRGGEMLSRPKSFSGTSGVIRFDRPAGEVDGGHDGDGARTSCGDRLRRRARALARARAAAMGAPGRSNWLEKGSQMVETLRYGLIGAGMMGARARAQPRDHSRLAQSRPCPTPTRAREPRAPAPSAADVQAVRRPSRASGKRRGGRDRHREPERYPQGDPRRRVRGARSRSRCWCEKPVCTRIEDCRGAGAGAPAPQGADLGRDGVSLHAADGRADRPGPRRRGRRAPDARHARAPLSFSAQGRRLEPLFAAHRRHPGREMLPLLRSHAPDRSGRARRGSTPRAPWT